MPDALPPLVRTGTVRLAATLLLCMPLAPLHAQVTVYNSFESWLAAVSAPATDTFGDLVPGELTPGPLNRSLDPLYSYRISAPDGFVPLASEDAVWLSTDLSDDPIMFDNFSSNTRAFGGHFLGTDRVGAPMEASLLLTWITADGSGSVTVPFTGGDAFFGFTSVGSLTSVTFSASAAGDDPVWPTVSDVYLAGRARHEPPVKVPEPSSLLLLSGGMVMMAVAARTRRREH